MKIVFFALLTLWIAVKAAYGVQGEEQLPRSSRSEATTPSRKEKGADIASALFE